MLLTITTTHRPASDQGFLLHKHPDRYQSFDLSFGKIQVFYPEVGAERCSACLLLDVDPIAMVRGKPPQACPETGDRASCRETRAAGLGGSA
jgi:RNA repair, ligase-Pnkp-associating, region of Hen1